MPKTSAGLLVYRCGAAGLELLLAHPGGPLWKSRDAGAWTIPKGEPEPGEALASAARRELLEETGFSVGDELVPLGPVTQKSGKVVHAWAVEADVPLETFRSNTCEIEWPPRSGRTLTIPEVDRVAYFDVEQARAKINPAQVALIDELIRKLG